MPLVAARSGQSPLAHGLFTVLHCEADVYKGGRCGREMPAEVGGGGRGVAADREGSSLQMRSESIGSTGSSAYCNFAISSLPYGDQW